MSNEKTTKEKTQAWIKKLVSIRKQISKEWIYNMSQSIERDKLIEADQNINGTILTLCELEGRLIAQEEQEEQEAKGGVME